MNLSFTNEVAEPDNYLPETVSSEPVATSRRSNVLQADDASSRMNGLLEYLNASGFVFEPWQVAAYVTAVRTKPFVILAGISGTGKTKLPGLVAAATGAVCHVEPVRPDWTDSSELLGYQRLNGVFEPGPLLRFAHQAEQSPEEQFFFVLDEMNIARVEYYLAEVLSHIEERREGTDGVIRSQPLRPYAGRGPDEPEWSKVCLPGNLCIVGSVNMDETTYGFSKKVLDRAFVIEFSTVDLSAIAGYDPDVARLVNYWGRAEWATEALSLPSHPRRGDGQVQQVVETLTAVNSALEQGQLQVGYRVRDEIAMFCLAADTCIDSFTTEEGGAVHPLDLAVAMKVLPRVQGSGESIRKVLDGLQAWATPDADSTTQSGFPACADRINLMRRRLSESGFTNYWL